MRKLSSGHSPTPSTEAACGGPVYADARIVQKRYLVHVAGHNLGILMRLLIGAGTPKETAARSRAYLLFLYTEQAVAIIPCRRIPDGFAIQAMAVLAEPA